METFIEKNNNALNHVIFYELHIKFWLGNKKLNETNFQCNASLHLTYLLSLLIHSSFVISHQEGVLSVGLF